MYCVSYSLIIILIAYLFTIIISICVNSSIINDIYEKDFLSQKPITSSHILNRPINPLRIRPYQLWSGIILKFINNSESVPK